MYVASCYDLYFLVQRNLTDMRLQLVGKLVPALVRRLIEKITSTRLKMKLNCLHIYPHQQVIRGKEIGCSMLLWTL